MGAKLIYRAFTISLPSPPGYSKLWATPLRANNIPVSDLFTAIPGSLAQTAWTIYGTYL